MTPSAAAEIRSSAAALAGRSATVDQLFLASLRRCAPRLAAAATPRLAAAIVAAIAADADGLEEVPAALNAILHGRSAEPRASAVIGLALLAALAHELGPRFDEPARAAWSEAYVKLVERLMTARWNRIDLVA